VIGATTTMAALEHSTKMRGFANGIIARSASTCGAVQIRNMATVGGNLANASPAADTATPLLALDAIVVLQGKGGTRTLPLQKFWSGPHSTVLNGGLLIEIHIPDCKPRSGWSFQKLGRTESDIAQVNAAAGLQCDRSGVCTHVRIALGAVAPTPMRAMAAEAMMVGQKLSAALLDQVAEQVSREVRPITDVRATAEYRRAMSGVLVRRALLECAANAGCEL
jgi:carbon-monoxide dehydrogenase medium subunit